jgi:hypothetical protein
MYEINLLISENEKTTLVKNYNSSVAPVIGDHIVLSNDVDSYFIVKKRILSINSSIIVCLGVIETPKDGVIYAP